MERFSVAENIPINFRKQGQVLSKDPDDKTIYDEKKRYRYVISDITTTFTFFVAIFFPSVTGEFPMLGEHSSFSCPQLKVLHPLRNVRWTQAHSVKIRIHRRAPAEFRGRRFSKLGPEVVPGATLLPLRHRFWSITIPMLFGRRWNGDLQAVFSTYQRS